MVAETIHQILEAGYKLEDNIAANEHMFNTTFNGATGFGAINTAGDRMFGYEMKIWSTI